MHLPAGAMSSCTQSHGTKLCKQHVAATTRTDQTDSWIKTESGGPIRAPPNYPRLHALGNCSYTPIGSQHVAEDTPAFSSRLLFLLPVSYAWTIGVFFPSVNTNYNQSVREICSHAWISSIQRQTIFQFHTDVKYKKCPASSSGNKLILLHGLFLETSFMSQ